MGEHRECLAGLALPEYLIAEVKRFIAGEFDFVPLLKLSGECRNRQQRGQHDERELRNAGAGRGG